MATIPSKRQANKLDEPPRQDSCSLSLDARSIPRWDPRSSVYLYIQNSNLPPRFSQFQSYIFPSILHMSVLFAVFSPPSRGSFSSPTPDSDIFLSFSAHTC